MYYQLVQYCDSTLIFLIYYLISILGIVDIAKNEMLNSNRNLTAVVLSLALAAQYALDAIFLDKLLFFLKDHYIIWVLFDNLATVGTMVVLWKKLRVELKEVRFVHQ